MHVDREICRRLDEELSLRNRVHVDLRCRTVRVTRQSKERIENEGLPLSLVRQIWDRCISWPHSVGIPRIPRNEEKIHRLFGYVAMWLLRSALHLQRLFLLMRSPNRVVVEYERG